jgi:hypothetical protein
MRKLVVLAALLMLAAGAVFAETTSEHDLTLEIQEVNDVAVSAPTTLVALQLPATAVAGAWPTPPTNSDKTLQYTVINSTGETRQITVEMDTTAPTGTELSVDVTVQGGCGTDPTGGFLPISMAGAPLITLIPSCATGSSGAGLSYKFAITAATGAEATGLLANTGSPAERTVTYTILTTTP